MDQKEFVRRLEQIKDNINLCKKVLTDDFKSIAGIKSTTALGLSEAIGKLETVFLYTVQEWGILKAELDLNKK